MELMTYKTRAVRTLSLLILVALLAALNPVSLTGNVALAQDAGAPTLTATAGTANQVDLEWTEVAGAGDYQLWRWETSEGWAAVDTSIEARTYTDTGVAAGKTYYYQVSADGGSTWSNRPSVTVGAYNASTLGTPAASSTAIGLSWSAVTGAASYELWRFDASWEQIGGTLSATTYSDTAVEIGKTYYYQVIAVGPAGRGAWSNRVNATVPSTTPGAPINFSATPGDAQAMLSWDAPTSNGGSAITGYEYRYRMVGGSWSNWMATVPAMSRTATVTGLTNESDYNFEARAENANGAGPAASDNAMPMSVVPGIPTGLGTTSTGATEITLSWTAVDGAASYHLQRRTNGGAWGSPMDAGSGTTYTDMGLAPSTTYDYEVRAVNAAGSSDWSAVVTAATTAPTAPDAVSDLAASASADMITLSWTMPAGNGAAITGYDLDVSDDGSDWSDLMTLAATATSYDHMNLGPGTMKYYRIRAMNAVGYSAWSASAMDTVDAVAPGKPTLYASPSGTTIMLSWVAPAASGGADITRYTIQVSNDGTTRWGALATKAGDDTTHDHALPTTATGTTRYYRISATNAAGTGEWSDIASATTAGAAPPRGGATDASSPRSLTVSAVDLATDAPQGTSTTSLNLTWLVPSTPPDDGDGNTALSYEAEVWDPATQTWGTVMNATSETDSTPMTATITLTTAPVGGTLADTGLMGTTSYTYRVRAVDGTERGTWSEQVSGTTVAVSPSPPTLTATAMGTDKIVLTWSVSDDGGSDIVGYYLMIGSIGSNPSESVTADGDVVDDITLLPAAQQSVTVSGLDGNAGSSFWISAVNGISETGSPPNLLAAVSAWSEIVEATTAMGVPGMPTVTLNNATARQIDITVTAALQDDGSTPNNGGSPVTSHEIQVYDAANDSWTILQDSLTLTYMHTGLGNNVMMYYRARSKNNIGASSWATESATTAAGAPSAPKLVATVTGPDRITLSWTAPNDGGQEITSYMIEISTDGESFNDAAEGTDAGLTGLTGTSRTATHTGLTAGDTRHYRIAATNETGEGTQSNTVMATTTTGGRPGAPTWPDSEALTATANSVTLNWEAPEAGPVTGYDIAMWADGQWMIIASNIASEPTEYLESGLPGATTHYFSVRARNANGAGPWSTVESIATQAGSAGKPALTATPDGATKIVLTWTAPDSGGGTITDYLVQVSNNGTIGWAAFDPTDTENIVTVDTVTYTRVATPDGAPAPPLTVTHSGLTGLTRKYYRVLAATATTATPVTDAGSHGAWSDVMSATTPAGKPGTPTWPDEDAPPAFDALAVTASSITVAWEAPAHGGSAITGYQIQVWDDGAWMDLMSVGGSVTSYMHSGLPGATQRFYRVRAMNAVGYSDWSATHSGTTSDGMPGAPVLHADQNGSTEIRLTWTAPATGVATNGQIRNYHIQVSSDGQSGWTAPQTSTTIVGGERVHQTSDGSAEDDTQNYSHTGLAPSTTRYYRVRAVNSATPAAIGPWSNVAMATTTGGTPGRPALTATASGTSMINLAWTPPTGDGGSAISGYELQYWDGSNGWMALATPAAGVTSHTHANITGGTTKYYRIRAENSGGSGLWSTVAYATTATAVPSPPTLVAMADGATKIMLTWTAGHDGGLPIMSYHLQHSTDRGSSWTDIDASIAASMSMTHTDEEGLTGGTTKHYRIRATNSMGTGGWSPLASATTDNSVPGKPTLTASPLPNAVYLSWASPATPTGGLSITRYEVEKWDSANRRWVHLRNTNGTNTTDSGLMNGKRYFYRVRAVNSMGDGPWSTFRSAVPAVPTGQ